MSICGWPARPVWECNLSTEGLNTIKFSDFTFSVGLDSQNKCQEPGHSVQARLNGRVNHGGVFLDTFSASYAKIIDIERELKIGGGACIGLFSLWGSNSFNGFLTTNDPFPINFSWNHDFV